MVEICDNVLMDNIILLIMNVVNKKQMLVDLVVWLNIVMENIIVCGDGVNDLLMLEYVGIGIVWKVKLVVWEKIYYQINYYGFELFFFFIEDEL